MSAHLAQGDIVMIYLAKNATAIGLIRFIGTVFNAGTKPYVGMEMVEPIEQGHDGTINGFSYFKAQRGCGIHVELAKIVKKLTNEEIFLKLREMTQMFKVRWKDCSTAVGMYNQHVQAHNTLERECRMYGTFSSSLSSQTKHDHNYNNAKQQNPSDIHSHDSNECHSSLPLSSFGPQNKPGTIPANIPSTTTNTTDSFNSLRNCKNTSLFHKNECPNEAGLFFFFFFLVVCVFFFFFLSIRTVTLQNKYNFFFELIVIIIALLCAMNEKDQITYHLQTVSTRPRYETVQPHLQAIQTYV
ncbi:hypothetical protein RFI_10903 [Reticulomyxa filosa]|uniref:CAP-Gly domain-containing protein n=1 Tax=Reticulomyxa filosa TaxID=46433 RepID=X6NIS8_RETFI|nr:hypothetical protein RFI_10903 [Reticulomyxa filosa]|eukprot:ETO26235.1 hypothetical protein RFI_10903 [Reticulomyxa filosa]